MGEIKVRISRQKWLNNHEWMRSHFDGQLRAILILFGWGRGMVNLIRTETTYEYDGIGTEIPYPEYNQKYMITPDELELVFDWVDETIRGDFYELRL